MDLKQTAFAAWQKARDDIFRSWTYETDPANLQPKMSLLNRRIADHIRRYPSPGLEQSRVEKNLDAIEAPCSLREQNLLRGAFETEFDSAEAKSFAIIEEVERIGLEAFHVPDPLPPIRPEDVYLLTCLLGEMPISYQRYDLMSLRVPRKSGRADERQRNGNDSTSR